MVIATDSAVGLDEGTIRNLGIEVVEFPLFVNNVPRPAGVTMTPTEREELRLQVKDKQNQVSTSGLREEDLRALFDRHASDKVIMMHQSAKMSSLTATMLEKVKGDLADRDILLFDTHHMVSAYTVQVLQASRAVRAGVTFAELLALMERNRSNTRHLGVVYDLFFLQRTGRIGRAKAIMGAALKIIPLLGSSEEAGILQSIGKVRTAAQANQRFLTIMEQDMKDKGARRVTAVISHIGPYEKETQELAQMIQDAGWEASIEIYPTGPINMPHAGPDFYDLGYTVHAD